MVGAMTEVWKLTGDAALLGSAAAVIDATLRHLTWTDGDALAAGSTPVAGVLRESCEQNTLRGQPWPFNYASPIGSGVAEGCTPDQLQFKGIFVRYLTYYLQALASNSTAAAAVGGRTLQQRYAAAVSRQARSLWETAACLPLVPVAVGAAVQLPALFGSRWVGPCSGTAGSPSAATQSSALDAMSGDAIVACQLGV